MVRGVRIAGAVAIIIAVVMVVMLGAVSFALSPTGYYLPKGYRVSAVLYVPCAPFWPGEILGDAVGLQTNEYAVIARGYGWKGNVWEGFATRSGVMIIWHQGGSQNVVARIDLVCEQKHEITIVYGYDGQVKFSAKNEFIYGFIATVDRYSVVAENAAVSRPEPLPQQTTQPPAGTGYNPPTAQQVQAQGLIVGIIAGAGALIFAILLLVVGRK